jgi:hypothetical protein
MLRSPTRWGSPAGCRSRCPRCRPAPDDPGADHLGRRAVPGPAPLAIGAAILRSRLLSWTRSAAARSPTGCSRCCWPAAMPASPLDSADSWDASPARWWPPPPWLWWRSSSRPAGDSSAGRPALQPPPLRHRPDHRHLQHRLRDQVDLTTLTGELLAVVNQTVQPTRTSLWLRPQGAAGATDGTAAHRFLSRR